LATDATYSLPTTVLPYKPGEDGWTGLDLGLEERWWHDKSGSGLDLYALRIDPEAYDLGVAYDPDEPRLLEEWAEVTGADVVVNAGFFDDNDKATALVVIGGTPTGSSYRDFGGMLADLASGRPSLTWLAQTPFTDASGIEDAIQSAPMLVYDGGAVYSDSSNDSSRRTAVGIDRTGQVLLIAAPSGGYTLSALADRLLDPELDLERALNLDGGSSTGIRVESPWREIPALVPLPAVITLLRRTE
jgi:hypothetical protein